jgi:hypothetical protein
MFARKAARRSPLSARLLPKKGGLDGVPGAVQWNNVIRDHLRNEIGLRLTVGDEAQAVPLRVVDGKSLSCASEWKHR